MKEIEILGQKFLAGKEYIAPHNEAVLAYLDAAKRGQGLGEKALQVYKIRKEKEHGISKKAKV